MQNVKSIVQILLLLLLSACGSNKTMVNFAKDAKGNIGYINHKGKWIVPPSESWLAHTNFSQGLAGVQQNSDGKFGFINEKGILAIKPIFDNVDMFYNGLAPALQNDKWGYINKKGVYVIGPTYDVATPFKTSYASVRMDKKWALINTKGVIVIDTISKAPYSFPNKKSVSTFQGHNYNFGLVNLNGEVVVEPKYKWLNTGDNGLICACDERKCGYINEIGDTVIKFKFYEVGRFSDGLAPAKLLGDTAYIYLNMLGAQAINRTFVVAEEFKDGMAIVMENGKYGVINITGEYVLKPTYSLLFYHDMGCFEEFSTGLIYNKKGEVIWNSSLK